MELGGKVLLQASLTILRYMVDYTMGSARRVEANQLAVGLLPCLELRSVTHTQRKREDRQTNEKNRAVKCSVQLL